MLVEPKKQKPGKSADSRGFWELRGPATFRPGHLGLPIPYNVVFSDNPYQCGRPGLAFLLSLLRSICNRSRGPKTR
jgi:hypothetical protein